MALRTFPVRSVYDTLIEIVDGNIKSRGKSIQVDIVLLEDMIMILEDDIMGQSRRLSERFNLPMEPSPRQARKRPAMVKKKRKATGKTKILNEMASKKWKAYKKKSPNGKRTYIDIRAQVSRSMEYKKKVKKL